MKQSLAILFWISELLVRLPPWKALTLTEGFLGFQ